MLRNESDLAALNLSRREPRFTRRASTSPRTSRGEDQEMRDQSAGSSLSGSIPFASELLLVNTSGGFAVFGTRRRDTIMNAECAIILKCGRTLIPFTCQ